MVLTTSTDESGNWTYDLADNVVDGEHTVYVAISDETGKIQKKGNPLSFLVREARAVTETDFLGEAALAAEVDVAGPAATSMKRYLWLALGLVLIVGLLALRGIRASKKEALKEDITKKEDDFNPDAFKDQ
jgi:hypothetical protein